MAALFLICQKVLNSKILAFNIPAKSISYCQSLQERFDFDFRLASPRKTRLGDFSYRPGTRPLITVNSDLNPYSFLITYIHEVAHCMVFRKYSFKVAPHGKEWKWAFQELAQPILTPEIFPIDVLIPLVRYLKNPKASTSGDPALLLALKKYDDPTEGAHKKPLIYLREGDLFVYNGRSFVKGPLRRTRVLCIETKSQKKYTIAAHALVEEQI